MEACVAKSNKKKVRTFYWYFRPIAIFCMVFGVLPLKNVYHKDGSRLRFRVRSIPYMLSSIIFYSTAYLLYYYSGFVFLKKNVDIGFIWRCVAFYLMLTRSAICFLYCTTHAKKFTKLIKLLELFDIKKIDLLSIEENTGIRRFMLWSILPLISGSVCLVLGFYELAKISEGILKHSLEDPMEIYVASRIFGLLGTWQIVPLLLYIYFAMIVKYNLLDIVEILKKNKVVCNFLMKHSETEVHNIGNTRHMYTIITSAVKKMGDIFGSFLAVDQFCLISMFVVNIYVFFFTNNQDIHLLLSTLLNALIVAALINISYVIKELGTKISDLLERYPMSEFNNTTQMEIQTFLLQAAMHPIEISAAGYFIMDRTQIPSILSSVATYIIVLVQVSPQISSYTNGTIVINT